MLQDLQKKRKTEIDFLNGHVVTLGRQFNIATPINSMICNLIKFKEDAF